tara:strand:- start:1019 stop:1684 length:666 start_codon:yes stop_codon:yes gene_type:complete
METWSKWPGNVDIFIVDDGSDRYPAKPLLENFHLEDWQPTLQLWRVTRNIGFNSHGCRNLIAKYADTDCIQFLDIDHVMYAPDVAKLKQMKVGPRDIIHHKNYNEYRQIVKDHPGHMNCFGIHKDLFWEAGGYDESFTGHHYGDREFLDRVFELEHRKIKSTCITSMNREGRHGRVNPNKSITEYDPTDDKFFWVPLAVDEVKKLRGTKTQRLDFPFIKIL